MSKIPAICFIDTETTGLYPNVDKILEIHWARVELPSLDVSQVGGFLVSHTKNNPLENGLTCWKPERFADADWSRSEPLHYVFRQLRTCMSGAAIGGQNPSFDIGFLKAAWGTNMPEPPEIDYHTIDVASMALPLMLAGVTEGIGLRHTRVWAGCPGEQMHRAESDVQDTVTVFRKLLRCGVPGLSPTGRP